MADWNVNVRNKILGHILAGTAYTQPIESNNVYLALGTAINAGTGVITEIGTSVGYARKSISILSAGSGADNLGDPSAGEVKNNAVISFGPCASTAWGEVTHFAILSEATAAADVDNTIISKALTTARTVAVGDSAEFAVDALDISLA